MAQMEGEHFSCLSDVYFVKPYNSKQCFQLKNVDSNGIHTCLTCL